MDLLATAGINPKVLIVEDDPVSAMLIKRLLVTEGIQADHATDGELALQMLSQQRYRLVISDWMMPGTNGIDLCREIRVREGPYVYFILCSAKGQREDRLEAYDAGVDDFLSKPLDRTQLRERLKVSKRILLMEEKLNLQNRQIERAAQSLQDMNESLQLASKRFEQLFNGLPVACFTFDEDGLVHEWNDSAEEAFKIEACAAFQKPIWSVMEEGGSDTWTRDLVQSIFTGIFRSSFDWTYITPGGSTRYLACNIICLRNSVGQPVGAVCASLDVTERTVAEQQVAKQIIQINEYTSQLHLQKEELEQMNEKLNHLAVTDGLTNIWNHRRFQEILEEALSDLKRHGEPFSLILLDVDHFKSFNDEFGHQAGDEVLALFADTLKSSARATEMPSRYGGEEFAIILQRCDASHAVLAAQRFHQAINRQVWPYRTVTSSFGLATCTDPGVSGKTIIAQADLALYHSKQTGRNRITSYSPALEHEAA